jgi:hypothetical protein
VRLGYPLQHVTEHEVIEHDPAWEDMSEYIVHLTEPTAGEGSDYENIMSILSSRCLKPGRTFGCARQRAPNAEQTQRAVCFSEIPIHQLRRLVQKRRTKYGLGFRKDHALKRGIQPIWHVELNSPAYVALQQLLSRADNASSDPIWQLTPLIDCPGEYGSTRYRFEWEREWRHIGEFKFNESDVAFLLIPEGLHSAASDFFEHVAEENLGPSYVCPYIDPTWTIHMVQGVLGKNSP